MSDEIKKAVELNQLSIVKEYIDGQDSNIRQQIDTHEGDTNNPHGVTKSQLGLENVPNVDFTSRVESLENKTSLSDFADDLGSSPTHTHSQYRTSANQDVIDNEIIADVSAIEGKIPAQASPSNQLADKSFVNSSIATETAHYISDGGEPFTSVSDLPTTGVTNNDYAFVTGTDSAGNTFYDKYKATVSGSSVTWAKEYRLNNSSFTAAQWAAISSGITDTLVSSYNTHIANSGIHVTSSEKSLIGSALQPSDVVNNLTSTSTTTPLSANQGKVLNDAISAISNYSRRTRKNITSNLTNLSTAIAEQNLEKYGYSIGDYFVGASGYTYHLADMDCNYGGYKHYAVVATHHCGIVVDTHATSKWQASGTPITSYSASTLHTYLSETVLNNIKSDFNTLFGGWSNHLIARTERDNAVGGVGTGWNGLANCLICAMTEVQVYGTRVFGCDEYQTATGCKPLELFKKYRFSEIYGNIWVWLRSLNSSSNACLVSNLGVALYENVIADSRVSGLILFK